MIEALLVAETFVSLGVIVLLVRGFLQHITQLEDRQNKERRILEAQIAMAFQHPEAVPVALHDPDDEGEEVSYVDDAKMVELEGRRR